MTTITIPDTLAGQMRAVAEDIGTTLEACIQEALERYMEAREDEEDRRDGMAALEEYRRNPPSQPFTLDDAMKRYGLTREDFAP